MANDLGVVTGYPDGTFKPTALVTRAEFAAMMTRALAIPESALKGFKTSSFKDVPADHWAVTYLGYCNSKGIMTGYEDGTARPNQTITVNEAMTMVCRAIGYTNQAKELVGSWPANYIALAQQLGLYDDVAATATTDRASAAQIIYNALPVTLVYIDADGATQAQSGAPSMLKNLGGRVVNGGDGVVLTSAMAENAAINVNAYVGQFVNAWTNKDGEIIAVEVLSTTVNGKLKISDRELGDYYVSKELFNGAGTATNFRYDLGATTPSAASWVVNGKTQPGAKAAYTTNTSDVTLAVKLNGKTITEVYSVLEWNKVAMDQFDADNLNIKKQEIKIDGNTFKFDKDKNGDIDTSKFALLGVTSLDKIATDNIVEIYTDNGTVNGKITKIAVGTKTVTGTVTKVDLDDEEYYIDGVAYSLTTTGSAAAAGTMITAPDTGETGTAYLNYDGDIAVWDADDATAGNYAIYLGSKAETSSTLGDVTTTVGLVLKDGTKKEFTMASDYTTKGGVTPSTNLAPQLVSYSFNKKGEINTDITPAATNVYTTAKVNPNRTAFNDIKFASEVVVFIHDGSEWTVGTLKDLKTNTNINLVYALDSNGKIAAVAGQKGDAADTNDSYGVINAVQKGLDSAGDKVWTVKGFMDGKELAAETDKTGSAQPYNRSCNDVNIASIYKITVDGSGVVTNITSVTTADDAANADNGGVYYDCTGGAVVTTAGSKQIEVNIGSKRTLALTDDVVVYVWNADDKIFELGTLADAKNSQISVLALMSASDWANDGRYNTIVVW